MDTKLKGLLLSFFRYIYRISLNSLPQRGFVSSRIKKRHYLMKKEEWIDEVLKKKQENGQERKMQIFAGTGGKFTLAGRDYLNFSSNDYLNLTHHPDVLKSSRYFLDMYGSGATASRLTTGTLGVHEELEKQIAIFKGYPHALLFGSGYLSNMGVITSLVGHGDHIFLDRFIHASIVDAAVNSRAKTHRFYHNDCEHLSEVLNKVKGGRRLIVIEALYSMDGDEAALEDIVTVAERYDAMIMVDEAHATGVIGPGGRGLVSKHDLMNHVNISGGTLSKALGGYGGFNACSHRIRDLCVNKARTLIYSTAPSPASAGAALGALQVIVQNPLFGALLLQRACAFRKRLGDAGFTIPKGSSQIVPVIVGDNSKTMSFAERLLTQGIIARGIRPPTVPKGTSRVRFSVTLSHGHDDLEFAARTIIATGQLLGMI